MSEKRIYHNCIHIFNFGQISIHNGESVTFDFQLHVFSFGSCLVFLEGLKFENDFLFL